MGEVRVYGAPSEMAGKWIREADHDAALRRAKAEVWREAATHVLTCMHAVDAANDFDARAARIEEGE